MLVGKQVAEGAMGTTCGGRKLRLLVAHPGLRCPLDFSAALGGVRCVGDRYASAGARAYRRPHLEISIWV